MWVATEFVTLYTEFESFAFVSHAWISLSLFVVGLFYSQIRPPFSSHQQGRQDPSQTVGHRLMVLNVTRWLLF